MLHDSDALVKCLEGHALFSVPDKDTSIYQSIDYNKPQLMLFFFFFSGEAEHLSF